MNFSTIHQRFKKMQTRDELFEAVVNTPFEDVLHVTELGLGVVVLLLANKKEGTLDRIALSNTEFAKGAVRFSVKPFHDIKIPLTYRRNLLIEAIQSRSSQRTEDWRYMFAPALTAEEARFNQAGAGIASSVIYPLCSDTEHAYGAMIFSYYEPLHVIGDAHDEFMKKYTTIVSEVLEAYQLA